AGVASPSIKAFMACFASSHVRSLEAFGPLEILARNSWIGMLRLVQAALGLGEIFPAAGPRILSRPDRGCAVGAADAWIITVMQCIIGNFVDPNVGPDILPSPLRERIDLDQLKFLIPFDQLCIGSRGRLIPPDPGDPCVEPLEHSNEGLHLA